MSVLSAILVTSTLAVLAVVLLARGPSRYELVLEVPVDTRVEIDEPISFDLDVPIDTLLTEKEIDLSGLVLPLDSHMHVDGVVDLDTTIPISTEVMTPLGIRVPIRANVPIKAAIPLRQHLHVTDRLNLAMEHVRIPMKTTVPVRVSFALRQTFRVRTVVEVPLRLATLAPRLRAKSEAEVEPTGEG